MSAISVRGLDDAARKQLATQTKERDRSMEWEVRDILTKAARRPHVGMALLAAAQDVGGVEGLPIPAREDVARARSEEHTSELQSRGQLVCRLLLEKKKKAKLTLLYMQVARCDNY